MSLGRDCWREVRQTIQELLGEDCATIRDNLDLRSRVLIPMDQVEMGLPATIGDYTDFFVSKHHAANCGEIFRGNRDLSPNWYHMPVGYHGRSSSIVVSGKGIRRPRGQYLDADGKATQGACRNLDFELEMACFVGPGNEMGTSIPVDLAEDHIFGLVLMNDWSARDIQRWEAVPLGPFNGKNFATTISPWIVTLDALEPFRCTPPPRDSEPLPYLRQADPKSYNIHLEVSITPVGSKIPAVVSRSNYQNLNWTLAQFIAHHSRGGCNLRTGDLMGTGTISGETEGSYGSMLELCWGGTRQVELPGSDGCTRTFLEDGDTVIFEGYCQGDGFRVGFGHCTGLVLPALPDGSV
eukprot:CAMPEP_0117694766 /NCGR_PEP_ID=MMETSP0804-20121206/27675_1 /TAXON_ID=1074897 /ORGANISM="Tetraselmis astigmatica, Strain CCMP880" /LENGTH=351 /DNA_ID=CAMNT_0005508581 /DNA_START=389 /DNA_END=1444 /DNA_ORIENTATION=-